MVGTAAERGTEIVAQDVRKETHYLYMDLLPETRSEASFPLKIENRILGVLDVQSDRVSAFHESDILVLRALANNIALAIESTHLYDNLQSRADQISSVFEVSHALTSILNLDDLLVEVVHLIQNRFGYPFVHVYTVHPGRRLVIYQVGTGERSEAMKQQGRNFPLDAPKGLISWVARNGQTYLANEVTLDPLYLPADLPPYNTRSELTVPLATAGEVLGVLDIQSQEPDAFDENDRSLFEALAAPIAIAMRNANLYRSEQWRRRVAESFRDVANLITASLPVNELLDFILHKLHDVLPCDASAIWLLQEEGLSEASGLVSAGASRLRLGATLNIEPAKVLEVLQQEPVLHILNRALESDQPFIRKLDDPSGPLGTALGFQANYSSIAAPMRVGKRTLGLLTLVHNQNGRYGSEAQAITATFASYAAVALQNTKLYRESQEQALVSTMLLQVAEASQSIETVQDLLSTMIRITRLLMGVKKCAFLIWEDGLQSFILKAWYGFEPATDGGGQAEQRFSASLPALSRLSTQRSIYYLDDPGSELNLPEMRPEPGRGTVIMLPMLVRGELSGALLVGLQTGSIEEQSADFDPKALAILQGIAHQTSITIDNLQLLEARQEEAYVTAALLQVAQAVVTSSDLNDTLDTIVHLLPILVGIETCAIYLWDAVSQVFRPTQVSGRSRREEEIILAHPFAPGENRLLDAIHQSGNPHMCPITTPELPFEEWGNLDCQPYDQGSSPPATQHTDWVLAYPLTLQSQVMGVMLVREMNASPSFWERRLEIIHGIAQQASMAIQNDIMRQELVQTERMEREIQLARQIQETFLPDTLPSLPKWELDMRWETAREIGGDFYDFFKLDDQRIGLVIADVADKGLPAALYMTVTRTLIRASANDRSSPAKVLEDVNRLLVNDSSESMFVTAVYITLSLKTGELTYANAGHNRPLLYHVNTRAVEKLPKGGTALGILEDPKLENHSLTLEPGDALVLFTDGVTDLQAPDGTFFGDARLEELVQAHGNEIIQNMLEELDDALIEFRRGVPPSDDITVLAVRREPVKKMRKKKAEEG
jgi:serine phosphatase RsbU (regulator of sigma subunit)/putative methionine-R-sulfoxide reductase with GAF domain